MFSAMKTDTKRAQGHIAKDNLLIKFSNWNRGRWGRVTFLLGLSTN